MREIVIHPQESVCVILVEMDLTALVSCFLIFNLINQFSNLIFVFSSSKEFDCPSVPVLGVCSNQGTCDDTTGTCICNEGFTSFQCLGENSF